MSTFWYKQCPRCEQGQLFIHRNCETDGLYLHCDECEWGFSDPTQCDLVSGGYIAVFIHYDVPTLKEIEARGWSAFALHEVAD